MPGETSGSPNLLIVTTSRYRRTSVRALVEAATNDHTIAAPLHDALWAVLWNRRYEDVDEPLWMPDSAYSGVLAFTHRLDDQTQLTGVDTNEAFIAFRVQQAVPPTGSRVRVLPAAREHWRLADVQPIGLELVVRFDERKMVTDTAWIDAFREGVRRLAMTFDQRRERLASRRAQLGALQEPSSLEEIWREQVSAISDRLALETEFTPKEHAALTRARARGNRTSDEEERRIIAARKKRFADRVAAEVAQFRETAWPPIRNRAMEEIRRYVDYRTEVVRLEDAMQGIRVLADRVTKAHDMLDAISCAEFHVVSFAFDPSQLDEPAYAEELLRTIELLHAAIPLRAVSNAATFSAYRAPTAGPSVIPPRY